MSLALDSRETLEYTPPNLIFHSHRSFYMSETTTLPPGDSTITAKDCIKMAVVPNHQDIRNGEKSMLAPKGRHLDVFVICMV